MCIERIKKRKVVLLPLTSSRSESLDCIVALVGCDPVFLAVIPVA
jgi:hypothetical protein